MHSIWCNYEHRGMASGREIWYRINDALPCTTLEHGSSQTLLSRSLIWSWSFLALAMLWARSLEVWSNGASKLPAQRLLQVFSRQFASNKTQEVLVSLEVYVNLTLVDVRFSNSGDTDRASTRVLRLLRCGLDRQIVIFCQTKRTWQEHARIFLDVHSKGWPVIPAAVGIRIYHWSILRAGRHKKEQLR